MATVPPVTDHLIEQVLVVPTAVFHRLGHFQGFSADTARYLEELLSPQHTRFMVRAEAELDPEFKQLIPYCVFRYTDASGVPHLFQYTRGRGQGEARLHSKRSIGVGGHISTLDGGAADGGDLYQTGLARELAEEVEIGAPFTMRCVGLINDDETEVGRVHLGVVHLYDLERPAVASRETDILESGFRPVSELLTSLVRFETWSKICLEALFARQ
jgi:predicted NUDIX family phosphoesterase